MAEAEKDKNEKKAIVRKGNSLRKAIAWVAGIVFATTIILPCLLYIPFVQNGVKDAVAYFVNNNTDMQMEVGRIMLKFPLKLSIDDVLVRDAKSDTMVYAKNLSADVKLLPLLRQKVDILSVSLNDAVYKMTSEDSSMILRAEIKRFGLRRSDVLLDKNEVNLRMITLKGGKVRMLLDTEKQVAAPADTSAVLPWNLNIGKVVLDDFSYNMQMLPLIDNIEAKIARAILSECGVNLAESKVNLGYFGVDNADIKYYYPPIAENQIVTTDSLVVDSVSAVQDWTINADSLRLNGSSVVYAVTGSTPTDGLDLNYLALNGINIALDKVYNKGAEIKLSLTKFEAKERSGLRIKSGQGHVAIDSKMMNADGIKVETDNSMMSLDALVGADFAENEVSPINVEMGAKLGLKDVEILYPILHSIIGDMPKTPIAMNVDIAGTPKRLDIEKAHLGMNEYLSIDVNGYAENVINSDKLKASIDFSGDFMNLDFVKQIALEDSAMREEIDIPDMKLKGYAMYGPNIAKGNLDVKLVNGDMVFDGDWNGNAESYNAVLVLDSFPVQSILPKSLFKSITANAIVKGKGYDVFDSRTNIDAGISIKELAYGNKVYRDVKAKATVSEQNAMIDMKSKNTDCDMDLSMFYRLDTAQYEFAVNGVINNIDLKSLSLSETVSKGNGEIVAFGSANVTTNAYNVDLGLQNFKWTLPDATYSTPSLNATFVSTNENISISAQESDMLLDFTASCGIDTLLARFDRSMKIVEHEINEKYLDIDTLQEALPQFACDLKVGEHNLIKQALNAYDVKMEDMWFNIVNDSTIYLNGTIMGVESGTMRLDTVTVFASQRNKYLSYNLHVGNEKGTNDEFAQVTLRGGVRGSMLGMLLEQSNIKGEQGFRFGLNARLSDTTVNVNVFPKQPIIGYRKWDVNDGNKIEYDYLKNHFEADLNLRSDSSFVTLQTVHRDGKTGQGDVKLSLGGVEISEWLKVSPFIPPMSGVLSADVRLILDRKNILGGGTTRLKQFKFNRKQVGDFALKVGLELDPIKNYIKLISSFDVNGRRAVVARGSLNDTTSQNPYNISVKVDSFPMDIVNPFVPGDLAKLGGALNGEMNVTGSFTEPEINGYLQGHKAVLNLPLFGSQLALSEDKIAVESNVVRFKKYGIYGSNNNPIAIDGYVNLMPIDELKMNLSMKGNNVEFVNSKQRRKMELFGKGYANVDATVKGTMNDMNVDASLTILPTTNLTYVLQTDVSTLSTQTDENMVRFVNLSDTVKVETDSLTNLELTKSNFKLNAKLNLQQGSKFSVYLSNSGNDRVELQGSGILNYSQSSLGDMRLVGQYTLKDGFVRYTPPLLSEKMFVFKEGSYVSWAGDVLNPTLNIKATDEIKASVQQEGQDSRMINFDVTVNVGNTLNNMDLEFDLSTNEDVTVQNELLSMSASQRSSQAINMLLYGTYTGQGSVANMSGNPLYSFLNSQINRWAANTIKGVDLTLGMNQYDNKSGDAKSKSTTYSYKISKSLFNDRFKIVVGGNYNPGGDTDDNFANSLLNDISFVYMLNQSGTMSVKLFRHTGYESVLEGEVTETGGAFVIKRKLSTLKNMFRFKPRFFKKSTNDSQKQDTLMRKEESSLEESNNKK